MSAIVGWENSKGKPGKVPVRRDENPFPPLEAEGDLVEYHLSKSAASLIITLHTIRTRLNLEHIAFWGMNLRIEDAGPEAGDHPVDGFGLTKID